MKTPLDTTIFDEVGLQELTPEERERMLPYVYETLEKRVGLRLTNDATTEQMAEFAKLVDADADNPDIFAWLEKNFPNFDTVVDEELTQIKAELLDMAEDVIKARK